MQLLLHQYFRGAFNMRGGNSVDLDSCVEEAPLAPSLVTTHKAEETATCHLSCHAAERCTGLI